MIDLINKRKKEEHKRTFTFFVVVWLNHGIPQQEQCHPKLQQVSIPIHSLSVKKSCVSLS